MSMPTIFPRRRPLAVLLALSIAATSFGTGGAAAQPPAGRPPAPPLPPNAAALDRLLARKQYLRLGEILRSAKRLDDVILNMNWESMKMRSGETAFINFAYAWDLWRVASSLRGNEAAELKATAVMVFVHAMALIQLDGAKCQDPSAPGHRLTQLITTFPHIWKHAATLSDAERTRTIAVALTLERVTAPRRDDEFVCQGGMDEMLDALARHGDKPLPPSRAQLGHIGKTEEVPSNPHYRPRFVPQEVWLPEQARIRAEMPKRLGELLESGKAPR